MAIKGVDKALKDVNREFNNQKKRIGGEVDKLAKGVFLALSNVPQKVAAKPPKNPQFAGNRNYKPSGTPMKAFVPRKDGGTDESASIWEYYQKLLKERADISNRQKAGEKRRIAGQQARFEAQRQKLVDRVKKLEARMSDQFQRDVQTVANTPKRSPKWKNAKRRMRQANNRLIDAHKNVRRSLMDLNKHYQGVNRGYAQRRKKPPRRFVFVHRLTSGGQSVRGAAIPNKAETFRVAGFPVPKSWGASGKYFLRHSWRTSKNTSGMGSAIGSALVWIKPEKKEFEDNERVLRQLEEGGSHMGGPRYEGYTVVFKQVGRFTHVTFVKKKYWTKKTVTVKPRHFVKNTLDRIKKKLHDTNYNAMQNSDWRSIGQTIS